MRDAKQIAAEIRKSEIWSGALLAELCKAADMTSDWDAADGESFESVAFKAAEKLGVEIWP